MPVRHRYRRQARQPADWQSAPRTTAIPAVCSLPSLQAYRDVMAAPRTPAFRGRARECQALDGLLDRVRGGESAVLVIRGEAGIGKTALMRYCARQASGCQLLRGAQDSDAGGF